MRNEELNIKYQALLLENDQLKEKIKRLKASLGEQFPPDLSDSVPFPKDQNELNYKAKRDEDTGSLFPINKKSDTKEKVRLFMSLFRGREDVYAKRWENSKKGKSGYSPACAHEWQPGICLKPAITCSECKNKDFLALNEEVIEDHLRGRHNLVVGIYPMLINETCNFLAIDFDDEGWQQDVSTLREVCAMFNIPIALERSRSGNGSHAWFFFDHPISAVLARKFGSALVTFSMTKRHDISFKSYDRLFPNQDTMPKGGFGNLIALPLQKAARTYKNTEFLDEDFQPYEDQWAFLASIRKLSKNDTEILTSGLSPGNELGLLKEDEESELKPWERTKIELLKNDFPERTEIIKANMLYIPKTGFSQKALNHLKRLAAFRNPEFYKAQAMRMPTYNKPRIISCSDENNSYLFLPRGCEDEIELLASKFKVELLWIDKTNAGKVIDVEFTGKLRDQQPNALSKLLEYNTGILCGTTAFGKTVVAIKLIAERKINTLILVNRVSLLSQWKNKLLEYLKINDNIEEDEISPKKKRKKVKSKIGLLGGGKHSLNGIIDIAVMNSLSRDGEVNELVKDYGTVIVDECHHVSAFSFEMILKNVHARYVCGLTATPVRKDGHHPIITMQCGKIRFRDDEKKQAAIRPFNHYIIPRFTDFQLIPPIRMDDDDMSITKLYAQAISDNSRNQMIINDIFYCFERGRNCLILTERTAHLELLTHELFTRIPDVVSLKGAMGAKETRDRLARITSAPLNKPIVIVATGKYIGEGFDAPRLDTLFLVMPISWKGTLQQYAGRLHRNFEGKREVLIYDYVDSQIPVFEKMYNKRLAGYSSIGYTVKENWETLITYQQPLPF